MGGFSEGVLPDADDFPSLSAELADDAPVAGHIVVVFFIPESAVGFRARVALRASVPETAIDEYADFLWRHDYVWPEIQVFQPFVQAVSVTLFMQFPA